MKEEDFFKNSKDACEYAAPVYGSCRNSDKPLKRTLFKVRLHWQSSYTYWEKDDKPVDSRTGYSGFVADVFVVSNVTGFDIIKWAMEALWERMTEDVDIDEYYPDIPCWDMTRSPGQESAVQIEDEEEFYEKVVAAKIIEVGPSYGWDDKVELPPDVFYKREFFPGRSLPALEDIKFDGE